MGNPGRYAMHCAAKIGDKKKISELIQQGCSPDIRDRLGFTPIHWAAQGGHYEAAECLIRSNCNLNLQLECSGPTPLVVAAQWKHWDIAQLLIQAGADVNILISCHRRTLLHVTLGHSKDPKPASTKIAAAKLDLPEVVEFMIGAGADINVRSNQEQNVLHLAGQRGFEEDWSGVVKTILRAQKLDLNARDKCGDTPLHYACRSGSVEIATLLAAAGADATIKNERDKSSLNECVSQNEIQLIKLLITHGAYLERSDYEAIAQVPLLKETILNDVELCTRDIIHRYNKQTLLGLYNLTGLSTDPPPIESLRINESDLSVQSYVEAEVLARSFCNVMEARPIVSLQFVCVRALVKYVERRKRMAGPFSAEKKRKCLKKY